jgi:hypothetical protein
MSKVYHVTTTLQLPWIVESGELRPHPNMDTGIGFTNFLGRRRSAPGTKPPGRHG